jgi:hypothetical protein
MAGVIGYLEQPEATDEWLLRLLVAIMLGLASIYFFRQAALGMLLVSLAAAFAGLAGLYGGFHRLGLRPLGRFWPGIARGLASVVLLACALPPSMGLPALFGLGLLALVLEGRLRRMSIPLAMSGILVAWVLGWAVASTHGPMFVRPFDLRFLDEPVRLWQGNGVEIDPTRLYAGNVPGPVGATSLGLVALGFLLLAYARRASWFYLVGFGGSIAIIASVSRQPLSVFLFTGPVVFFGGVLGAESRRLPLASWWRLGAGVMAGVVAELLLRRGIGVEAYGFGVVGAAGVMTLLQLFGLAGSPGILGAPPVPASRAGVPSLPRLGATSALQLATLVLFLPAGLVLLWRDRGLDRNEKMSLVAIGAGLYLLAAVASITWLWVLRLPA